MNKMIILEEEQLRQIVVESVKQVISERLVPTSNELSRPFGHRPVKGQPQMTLLFLCHIFGDQLELGLDYLKMLLEPPMQVLPILCLVSAERDISDSFCF